VESDKDVVKGNIACFMKGFGFVEPFAAEHEALEAFNAVVRREVPAALKNAYGRMGIPYRYMFAGVLPAAFHYVDLFAAGIAQQKPILVQFAAQLVLTYAYAPLVFVTVNWLQRRSLGVRCAWLCDAAITVYGFMFFFLGSWWIVDIPWYSFKVLGKMVWAVTMVACLSLAWLTFRTPRRKVAQRQPPP